jgi:hypothetical protein
MAMMGKINQMLAGIRRFASREKGLVTVEWVALSAGMVVAAIAVSYAVMHNTRVSASKVGQGISAAVTAKFGKNGSAL